MSKVDNYIGQQNCAHGQRQAPFIFKIFVSFVLMVAATHLVEMFPAGDEHRIGARGAPICAMTLAFRST